VVKEVTTASWRRFVDFRRLLRPLLAEGIPITIKWPAVNRSNCLICQLTIGFLNGTLDRSRSSVG
jgi:hypothetical protein